MENNWVDGQAGMAVLFTVRNQDGGAPWSVVEDVTFLLDTGEHPARIATRIGRTPHAIDQALRRAGRADLAYHFYAERDRTRR